MGDQYVPAIGEDFFDWALIMGAWAVGGEKIAANSGMPLGNKCVADNTAVLTGDQNFKGLGHLSPMLAMNKKNSTIQVTPKVTKPAMKSKR